MNEYEDGYSIGSIETALAISRMIADMDYDPDDQPSMLIERIQRWIFEERYAVRGKDR